MHSLHGHNDESPLRSFYLLSLHTVADSPSLAHTQAMSATDSIKNVWNKTRSACVNAAQTTQRATHNAVLRAEVARLQSKATDVKREFGPSAYDFMAAGDTESCNLLFEKTRERLAPIEEEIARKNAEMDAGKTDTNPVPSAPPPPTAPEA